MKENKEETKLQSEQKQWIDNFLDGERVMLDEFMYNLISKAIHSYASQFKSQLPIEQKTMNKQEAIQAMRQGKKVTHRYFDSTEWATITENRIVFEDGVRMRIDDFLSDRQQDAWDTDWSIFQEPSPIEQKIIPFLQDRIRNAFKAAESGMGSQFYPFDEESTESIKGMRRAYADVLVELQRSQPSPIEGVEREQLREAFEAGQHADEYDQWVKHNYDFDEWLATRKGSLYRENSL